MRHVASFILLVFLSGMVADSALAQGQPRKLSSHRDWDAFTRAENGEKTCYITSTPTRSRASRRGARRGLIFISVSHRPAFGVKDEVQVDVGYPLRQGSEARLQVDGKRAYQFFTEGSGAWAYDPKDDSSLVTAMKAGVNLVVRATSQRGTNTTDTYSLRGFTAAYNAITRACR